MKVALIGIGLDNNTCTRKELITELIENGHEVIVMNGNYIREDASILEELNVKHVQINKYSKSGSVLNELKILKKFLNTFKLLKIDLVIVYGIKKAPTISLAAKFAGIKNIYTVVNGVGRLFLLNGIRGKVLRSLSLPFIKKALKNSEIVFFQNPDDAQLIISKNLIISEKALVTNGSGINLDKFPRTQLPEGPPSFLMVTRLLYEKGVMEYIAAAKHVKSIYPEARFQLIGPFDKSSESRMKSDILPYIKDGTIEYLGRVTNVKSYYKDSTIYVLPSYYGEGVPRTTLEAMAIGRPIITTDSSGCRETVVENYNGFLVTPRSDIDLIDKMIWMIKNSDQIGIMGKNSRNMCEERFDVHEVNKFMIGKMGLVKH